MLSKQMFNPKKLHSTVAYINTADSYYQEMHNYIDLFYNIFSDMTKTGSAYWNDICHRYAQGTFQFSTGKRPGSRKWKEVLVRIDVCPLQRGNNLAAT